MLLVKCPDRDTLLDYIAGRLSDDDSDSLAEHLESCPECREELAAISDADDTLINLLRDPADTDPLLEESACIEAIRRAKQLDGIPTPDDEMSIQDQLGEYRLIERIGSGGMGKVYKALHKHLDRIVAVKVLPHWRADDSRAVERFECEMKAIGRLDHPHVVRAYDAREIDGRLVLIMEYVEGLDLAKVGRYLGRLDVADACEIARQAALGLQVAHEHGLVHRDVKPSNLMLTPEGQVKLLDLGLARLHGGLSQFSRPGWKRGGKGDRHLLCEAPGGPFRQKAPVPFSTENDMTDAGQAMGTADYMAPEQTSDSRTADIRADIYGLGATLYRLLAGRAPFDGPEYRGSLDKMLAHRHEPVPSIRDSRPDIPTGLAAVLDRMLAKSPDDRYSTPAEAAEALAPWCEGADLPALLERAMEAKTASPLPLGEGQDEGRRSPQPLAASHGRRFIATMLFLLLLIGGLGFVAGIMIRIKKDGRETAVEVPDGSTTRIDSDGNVNVNLSSDVKHTSPASSRKEQTPHDIWLKHRIAAVAGELAGQKALLERIDDLKIPVAELDALVESDPIAKQLHLKLGLLKMEYSQKTSKDTKAWRELQSLQKQYDQRLDELRKNVREKERSLIEKEIVKLTAQLASLRKQQKIIADGQVDVSLPNQAKKDKMNDATLNLLRRNTARLLVDQAMLIKHWEALETNGNFISLSQDLSKKLSRQKADWRFIKPDADVPGGRKPAYAPGDKFEWSLLDRFKKPNTTGAENFAERLVNDNNTYQYYQPIYAEQSCISCHQAVALNDPRRTTDGNQKHIAEGDLMSIICINLPLVAKYYSPTGSATAPIAGHPKPTIEVLNGSNSRIDAEGNVDIELPSRVSKGKQTAITSQEEPLRFGPVIERVVNAASEGKGGEGLDLESGKLVNLPKEFGQRSPKERNKWAAENNVDLLVFFTVHETMGQSVRNEPMPIVWRLWALEPFGLNLGVIGRPQWFNISETKLRSALSAAEFGMWDIFAVPLVHEPGGPVYFQFRNEPETFAFQTRKGELGILQVIRVTEEPRGMRIRYKLAQPPAAALTAMRDEKAIQGTWEVVGSTFGLVRKLPYSREVTTDQVLNTTKVIITSDTFKIVGRHVTNMAFPYRLNPTAKTKMIDFQTPGTTFSLVSYGIYQLEGNQLKICTSGLRSLGDENDRPDARILRPAELWAELGSDKELLVLRRVADAAITEDEKAIQGTWQVEEASAAATFGFVVNKKFVFSRNHMSTWVTIVHGGMGNKNDTGGGVEQRFKLTFGYALDPTVKPKRIDLATVTAPPLAPLHGIYELKGGRLTIAWATLPQAGKTGACPPSKLAASPNTALVVLKRVSKATEKAPRQENAREKPKAKPPAVNPAAELKALLGQWKVVAIEKGKDTDAAWGAICGFDSPMNPTNTIRLDLSQSFEGVVLRFMRSKPELVSSGWVPPGWTSNDGGYSFKIDPTVYPKRFDLIGQDGVSPYTRRVPDNMAAVGIYKLDGGRLKIRLSRYLSSVTGDQRPKDFSIKPDSADIAFTLERYTPTTTKRRLMRAG